MFYKFCFSILTFVNLSMSSISQAAAPVSQYNYIQERLLSGTPTVSILHSEKCDGVDNKPSFSPAPIGGSKINEFLILPEPNAHISYANSHFTIRPDGVSVIEFVRYKINANDTATITIFSLSPTTYKLLSEPAVLNCKVGEGIEFQPH